LRRGRALDPAGQRLDQGFRAFWLIRQGEVDDALGIAEILFHDKEKLRGGETRPDEKERLLRQAA
jgi:hypothetical protein